MKIHPLQVFLYQRQTHGCVAVSGKTNWRRERESGVFIPFTAAAGAAVAAADADVVAVRSAARLTLSLPHLSAPCRLSLSCTGCMHSPTSIEKHYAVINLVNAVASFDQLMIGLCSHFRNLASLLSTMATDRQQQQQQKRRRHWLRRLRRQRMQWR